MANDAANNATVSYKEASWIKEEHFHLRRFVTTRNIWTPSVNHF
jgi:hypothetical protein